MDSPVSIIIRISAPLAFTQADFTYDGDGARVKSVITTTQGSSTTYFVNNYYEVTDGVVTKYYYAGNQRIAMRKNGTLSYILGDHLGSTSLITNATGNVISDTKYKAWGEERYTSGTKQTPYSFTGQYGHQEEFGLLFYNSRYYDPSLSRFTSADSIVPDGVQGLDRYAYVNNSPVNYTDPTGHYACGDGENRECDSNPHSYKPPKKDPDHGNPSEDTDNPLIDIWNQFGEAGLEFIDNGCDRSPSTLLNNATCLDSASLATQDLATLFSSAGAVVTTATTLIGCAVPADLQLGCGVGYVVGIGIHVTFFNPYETIFSAVSFVATVRSDYVTDDTYFNSLHDWEVGEDTITGVLTVVPGTLTTDPFIDAGADIYATGYNHGYFCGASTILNC